MSLEEIPDKQAEQSCLFCKIVKKEIPAQLVFEDEHAVSFRDINPQAPSHLLVIPRKHFATIKELTDNTMLGSLFNTACQVAENEKLEDGFRLVVNTGDDGGQTVHHLHIHILGGRSMTWPPG